MTEDEEITDVRCLPYMPLQIERLRKSKAWLRCKRHPEMAFYLMNLWMRAWHELPAGSVEADDDVLADAAMCDPARWDAIRDEILRGWELRDGRYHHHVVAELAEEAATRLRGNRHRTAAAREARKTKRETGHVEPVTESVTDDVTEVVTSPEGKGREGNRPPAGARVHAREAELGSSRLRELVGDLPVLVDPNPAPVLELLDRGMTWPDIEAGIAAAIEGGFRPRYWRQLVGWVQNAAKDRLAEKPPDLGRRGRPPAAAAAPADPATVESGWRSLVRRWLEARTTWSPRWGPEPNEPGCKAPREILAEFGLTPPTAAAA